MAILKTKEWFVSELKKKQPEIFNKLLNIGEYKGVDNPILIETNLGECSVLAKNLLTGKMPTIMSAINPTLYFINKARIVHGLIYDYSNTVYINNRKSVSITCSIHGAYSQSPHDHLRGNGCNKCGIERARIATINNTIGWRYSNWQESGLNSKNFDSYKMYVIKCYKDDEEFYKIGKTFKDIKKRFPSVISMPYKYEPIVIIEGDSRYISELETKYKNKYKAYKYVPKIHFNGKHECFNINMFENA